MLGDAKLAADFADDMLGKCFMYRLYYKKYPKINGPSIQSILCWIYFQFLTAKGIYVIGFSYPVVPKDQARIRVQISAAHTEEDIDRTVAAFIEVGKSRNVI